MNKYIILKFAMVRSDYFFFKSNSNSLQDDDYVKLKVRMEKAGQ